MTYSSEVGKGNRAHHPFTTQPTMTYQELLNQLQQLNPEQLNQDVAIWNDDLDEYYQQDVELVFVDNTQDVLDVGHPVIRF